MVPLGMGIRVFGGGGSGRGEPLLCEEIKKRRSDDAYQAGILISSSIGYWSRGLML